MNTDLIATLKDLPSQQSGVLFEQLHQASLSATFYMRAMGLTLPGFDYVPTHAEVYAHLCRLTNSALQSYFAAQQAAPDGQAYDEIWGEEEDDLFSVCLTGIAAKADGFTVTVDFNLLYGR